MKSGVLKSNKLMSRVSDRDITTQDSMMRESKVGLPPRRTDMREGSQLKLSKNRLACCLHTIYYKRPYILLYMR